MKLMFSKKRLKKQEKKSKKNLNFNEKCAKKNKKKMSFLLKKIA